MPTPPAILLYAGELEMPPEPRRQVAERCALHLYRGDLGMLYAILTDLSHRRDGERRRPGYTTFVTTGAARWLSAVRLQWGPQATRAAARTRITAWGHIHPACSPTMCPDGQHVFFSLTLGRWNPRQQRYSDCTSATAWGQSSIETTIGQSLDWLDTITEEVR